MKYLQKFLLSLILLIFFDAFISSVLPYYLRPNLWLGYIVYTALFQTHIAAVCIGFIFGVIYDILHLTRFGVNTLLFVTVGYICGLVNKYINESILKVQFIVMFLSSILYILLYFLLLVILKTGKPGLQHLLSIVTTTISGFVVIQLLRFFYHKT